MKETEWECLAESGEADQWECACLACLEWQRAQPKEGPPPYDAATATGMYDH